MPFGELTDGTYGYHSRYGIVAALNYAARHGMNLSVTVYWRNLTAFENAGGSDDIELDDEGGGEVQFFGHGINPDTLREDMGQSSSREFFRQATYEHERVVEARGLSLFVVQFLPLKGEQA